MHISKEIKVYQFSREEHLETICYFIPGTYRKFYEIFDAVFQAKDFLMMEDFTLKETTLEQIFMFINK